MKHTKGLLLLSFWLLAMPFAFAQDITDFKRVLPTEQFKMQGDLTYCQLSHNQLALQVVINEGLCGEYMCDAEMRFTCNGNPIGKWFSVGKAYPEEELLFFYSETAKAWYVIDDLDSDDALQYDLYYISGNTVTFEGMYYESSYLKGEVYSTALRNPGPLFTIMRKNNQPVVNFTDNSGRKVGEFKKYIPDENEWVPSTNEELISKGTAFNWQKGFTPTLKYTKAIDLNGDGSPEKYNIDWATKEITYANYDAMLLLRKGNAKDYIHFSGDTLVLSAITYEGNLKKAYSYYFGLSKYNVAHMEKYSYTVASKNGAPAGLCNLTENFIVYYKEAVPSLEQFEPEHFCYSCYRRNFTLAELYKRFANKKDKNSFYNDCALLPVYYEIRWLMDETPLTAQNVQLYNDIAFYMSDFIPQDTDNRRQVAETCLDLLRTITYKFPERAVAWLNMADVYWNRNDNYKNPAKEAYKKYLELMKAQGKEAKVPQRVYERI